MSSRTISESDPTLRSPGTALTCPPNSAAILGHHVNDVLWTDDRDEVDDRVVAEAELAHVFLHLFEIKISKYHQLL